MPAFFFYRWSFLAPFLPVSFFTCIPVFPAFLFYLPFLAPFFAFLGFLAAPCFLRCPKSNEEQFDKNYHWKGQITPVSCAHIAYYTFTIHVSRTGDKTTLFLLIRNPKNAGRVFIHALLWRIFAVLRLSRVTYGSFCCQFHHCTGMGGGWLYQFWQCQNLESA